MQDVTPKNNENGRDSHMWIKKKVVFMLNFYFLLSLLQTVSLLLCFDYIHIYSVD